MNKIVVNDVFKAPKSGAPTFYLLPGIDGGDDLDPGGPIPPGGKSWFGMTDIEGFFADKNVNVVSPLGGPYSRQASIGPSAPTVVSPPCPTQMRRRTSR